MRLSPNEIDEGLEDSLPGLEDLVLPDPDLVHKQLLRIFAEDEHIMGENCECNPQILPSHSSRSGLVIVHNRYNMTDPLPCLLLQP